MCPLPHYVFIIGSKRYVKGKPLLQNLLTKQKLLSVSTIFAYEHFYDLPQECQMIVELNNVETEHGVFCSAYERDKVNHKFLFKQDCKISTEIFDNFSVINYHFHLAVLIKSILIYSSSRLFSMLERYFLIAS